MLHPSHFLFGAAALAIVLRGNVRRIAVTAAPALALWTLFGLSGGSSLPYKLPGYTLELMRFDSLSLLFGIIFCLITFAGIIYALHHPGGKEQAASLALAGSALGVVFAGDWITMFVFWELMSVASIFIIWMGDTPGSLKAGYRYLLVHVMGGGILFAGILLHLANGGSSEFLALTGQGPLTPAGWLILTGVAVNSAIPPLHAWLTDAYPECTVTGSVVQSAFTTKTAVYVLLRAFPGAEPLAVIGVIMALYGVVFAVLENDIRRLLSYHIVSQVGFMVAGVGLGTALSLDGAAAHAFCHILYKGLLFMGAGAIIYATGKSKLTELGGLVRQMPAVLVLFMVGAFSISGLPMFNGFISKTMTISAFGHEHRIVLELLLELASVGTFLSIGLKLAYHAFFGEDCKIKAKALPANMYVAMGFAAALCTLLGLFPQMLYDFLPNAAEYHPYTLTHVAGSLQLHLGTAAAFWLLLKVLKPKDAISLDVDWLYRKPFAALVGGIVALLRGIGRVMSTEGVALCVNAVPFDYEVDRRRAPVGLALFWIALFFSFAAYYAARH
ncbi:MAG: Na(+)/H(+) antiporter subunit D [Elusimicrobiota bacterium]